MKNKVLKNLIALGIFTVLLFGASQASAYFVAPNYYSNMNDYSKSQTEVFPYDGYALPYNQNQYSYTQPSYKYTQPYYYVQPSVQYIQQPTQYVQQPQTQQVQYVQQPVQYVNQAASVGNIKYVPQTTKVVTVATTNKVNTPVVTTTGATGNHVNYDSNYGNLMGASAYGAYSGQQVVYPAQQVSTGSNELTALSVKGSGSFLPSSVFQWFLVIILILAIIIIARMIGKTFSKDHITVTS